VILAANAIGLTAVSALDRRLVRRRGARPLLPVGLVIMPVCSTALYLLAGTGLLVRPWPCRPARLVTLSSLGLRLHDP